MQTCSDRRREEKMMEAMAGWIEASEIQADLLRQLEQVSSSHTALANENEALRDEMTRLRTCVKERSEIWIDACRELISQLCEIQTVFLGLEENFLQYVDRHFSTNLEEDTHRSSHSSPVHTPLECPYPVGSGAAGAHGATMAMEQCARTGDNTSAQSISCHGWMADMAGLVNHIKDLLGEISQVQDMVDRCEPALEPNAQHTETIEATRVGKLDEFSVRVLLASLKELLVKSYDDTVRAIGEVRTSLLLESEAYGRVGHFARETWKENIRLRQETFDMTQELERVRQVVDGMKTHRCEDGNFMSKDEIQKIAEETVKANIQFRHEIFGMRQEMEQLQELVDGAKTREALWMGSEEIRRIAQDTVRENILLRQEIYDLSGELQQWQLGERRCGGNREEDCGRQNSYERSCGDVAAKIEEVETFSHLVGTASESQHPKTACVLPATGTENGEDEMMTSFCETEDIVKLVEDVLQHVAMGLQSQALLFSTSDRVDKNELAREYFEEDLQNVMDSQYNPSTCQLEGESAARPEDEMMILMDLISGFNDDMEHTCDIFQELISKSSPKAVSDDSVSVCQLIPSAASEEIQKERMEEMNRLLLLTEFSMAQSEMMLNDEKQQVERIVLVQESMLVRIERTFQNVEREATGLRVSMSDCCARLKEAEACIQLLERQLQAAKIEKEVEEERRRLQLQKEVEEAENKATRAELQVRVLQKKLMTSRLLAARQKIDLSEDTNNITLSSVSSQLTEERSSTPLARPSSTGSNLVLRDWERTCARWESKYRSGLKEFFVQRTHYDEIHMYLHTDVIPFLRLTVRQTYQSLTFNQKLISCIVECFLESISCLVDPSDLNADWLNLIGLKTLQQVLQPWIRAAHDRDCLLETISNFRRKRSLAPFIIDAVEFELLSLIESR